MRIKIYSVLTFIFSLVFLVALGEIFVRIAYMPLFYSYNMEMWRYAKDLKQPNQNPKLPFCHKPNQQGNYYGVQVQTNQQGMRERNLPKMDTGKTKKRILFIGDSFTFGWGIAVGERFSNQVQNQLDSLYPNQYEVLNSGVGNTNSTMQVELFQTKGILLKPDLVVLNYFINDAEPTPKIMGKIGYWLFSKSYLLAFLSDKSQKIKVNLNQNFNWKTYYSDLYLPSKPALETNKNALIDLTKYCKTHQIKLFISNIPELHQTQNYPFLEANAFIRSIAEDTQTPFIDLLQPLKTYNPQALWVSPEDAHANALANKIMGNAIAKKIIESNILQAQ